MTRKPPKARRKRAQRKPAKTYEQAVDELFTGEVKGQRAYGKGTRRLDVMLL